jgi:phage shock protein B
MNFPSEIIVIPAIVIGLPWLILHYVTRWKTAATLTTDDERTLGDMHELARRLEDRLETVERLVSSENPNWQPRRIDLEEQAAKQDNIRTLERNR